MSTVKAIANSALPHSLRLTEDMTYFVIISHQRSGTHLLRESLISSPYIWCNAEIFFGTGSNPYSRKVTIEPFRILLERVFEYPIRRAMLEIGGVSATRPLACGFILQRNQAILREYTRIWSVLAGMNSVKVIWLRRNNLLDRYVSEKLAKRTGIWIWGLRQGGMRRKDETQVKLRLSRTELEANFCSVTNLDMNRRRLFRKHSVLAISYEDLVCKYQNTMVTVQRFLNVPPCVLSHAVRKVNTRPLSEIIYNYNELKSQFRQTKWYDFFDRQHVTDPTTSGMAGESLAWLGEH